MDDLRTTTINIKRAKLQPMRRLPLLRSFIIQTSAFVVMSSDAYVPPKVWVYETSDGSKFTMNRPTAGQRSEKELPVGEHQIQLYSMATPNGLKVTILLEELLELGKEAEYDAWPIDIMKLDQFGSDFVSINPNSKIPAMKIKEEDGSITNLFESGSIMLQLAERYDALIPERLKPAVTNWLFWQMGSAPYLGGGFGHFYKYADVKNKYAIDRFTMETKRQLHVLELQLQKHAYIAGDEYSIADIAIFPWYGLVVLNVVYEAADFLNASEYPHVLEWARRIRERPAVKRGLMVNRWWGEEPYLKERHSKEDFDPSMFPRL